MIIDTADTTTAKLAQLKAAGVTAIIRYDDRFTSGAWKQIGPAEARAIRDAGIMLGIVYEHGAQPSGEENGFADATYSVKMAAGRGQPAGSAVYFAVDYDATQSDIRNRIIPYFRGVQRGIGTSRLRVGVYGSGDVCKALRAQGLVDLTWITCSRGFSGSAAYIAAGLQDLWQTDCDKILFGLSVDYNSARNPNWGAFMPWGEAGPTPGDTTTKPLHDTAWVQTSLNSLGQIPPLAVDNINGPKTKAAVKVFQRAHDLTPDGIAGPITQAAIEQALNAQHLPPLGASPLAGKSLAYLIGADNPPAAQDASTITEVGYDETKPVSGGFSIKYGNLYDEKASGHFGPYLPPTDTAEEYGEMVPDPDGAGFEANIEVQVDRAREEGFKWIELDNADGYKIDDVLRALDMVAAGGLRSVAKNPGLLGAGAVRYVQHAIVDGAIVEKGAGTPQSMEALRREAGKPDLPVWFVFFGAGGAQAAQQCAQQITAGGYRNMGVSNSPGGEYTTSTIVIAPRLA